jgi:hypothetical protein
MLDQRRKVKDERANPSRKGPKFEIDMGSSLDTPVRHQVTCGRKREEYGLTAADRRRTRFGIGKRRENLVESHARIKQRSEKVLAGAKSTQGKPSFEVLTQISIETQIVFKQKNPFGPLRNRVSKDA